MKPAEKRILVVDDDDVFREVLSAALAKRGYAVDAASCLNDAVALARQAPPRYAVIDLKIDSESGLDCLPALRSINPSIRILILTGYSSIATAVSAIKLGASDYACKPLDADQILAILLEESQPSGAVPSTPPSVDRLEWEHIQRVLRTNNGNISATARDLGMHRRTLQRKLQKRPVKF